MELSQRSLLLDELIMAPKTETTFPHELFQDTWNPTPFDQTPADLQFPLTNNTSLLELISPPDHEFINYPCPYDDSFQPFLDALNSPEMFDSFYDDGLPPMAIHQDHLENDDQVRFLENFINGFEDEQMISCYNTTNNNNNAESCAQDGTPAPNMDIVISNNVGTCGEKKSKSKKPVGQPSKNLMAERRRRKRLNDRLSMLRSVVPKISKMDRTSILGDTIDYMRELLDKIHKLREEGLDEKISDVDKINLLGDFLKELKTPNDTTQVRNPPKFDVERRNGDTKVEVCCAAKPGLLLSTISTLVAFGLDIQQCVISCFSDFSLQASCFEVAEHRSLVSSDDVKLALFRNAGYGGRCL